jgi:sulfhydrogenase subunit gamma (sulfur reductase)
MMRAACTQLLEKNIASSQLFLSMERNMQCALGHCGHCQYGSKFICKNGPVFSYDEIADLFSVKGF